ncbi:hypothetical protein [Clavibacter sp. VKM Ac-2872]|uniref:hypothetical protein n=1 Tax=Clavibacter sp. VKM Ac-2872 TaxID=2783812 RepID=UPI00188B135B|nr:hypothetical protein [Clavibacter sp. VKM Ac-2872]MBF4625420.1 hypothetical protein [Clavibacter sp. VKM Ac-2872]
MVAGFAAEAMMPEGETDGPRFDWLPSGGAALGDSTINAMLSYTAVTLVLFGISLGGQATFDDKRHQERIRRGVGAVGVLMAVSALVLVIFAIAAPFSDVSKLPALVVVVPSAIICWSLGIEIGRFVVPDHRTQLEGTRASLARGEGRRQRLPRQTSGTWLAHLLVWAYAFAIAAATGLALGTSGMSAWLIASFSFVGVGVGLYLCLQLAATSLVVERLIFRVGIRFAAWLFFALMVLFTDAAIYVTGLASSTDLTVLLGLQLLIPLLFVRLGSKAPQFLVDVSLGGALARVCADDLERQISNLTTRLSELERLSRSAAPVGVRSRLRAGWEGFRTGLPS